ncbi:hypothetical protein L6R29_25180, partial [Myxococcota bacterium]|nr:hypothetical protein [Myxococcota bacterium]
KQTVSTSSVREVREKVGAAPCGCPITGRLQQTASTLMDTLLTDIVGMMIANEWHELVQVFANRPRPNIGLFRIQLRKSYP